MFKEHLKDVALEMLHFAAFVVVFCFIFGSFTVGTLYVIHLLFMRSM